MEALTEACERREDDLWAMSGIGWRRPILDWGLVALVVGLEVLWFSP